MKEHAFQVQVAHMLQPHNDDGTFAAVSLIERFNRHWIPEPNSGCWLWLSVVNAAGYGTIRDIDKRVRLAHRISYRLHIGEPGQLQVCHRCDVPSCVNPQHLFLGTDADNNRDKMLKGRAAVKLTPEIVRAIRSDTRGGPTIAKAYGVEWCTVYAIKKRKLWRHI